MSQVFLGCDPEFFLKDKNGKFIASCGLVGGTKEEPKPIGNGCSIQEDNVAVEFNIPPVDVMAGTVEEVVSKIQGYVNYVLTWVEETVCKPNNLDIAIVPSAVFDDEQLQSEQAQTFGCDPDYNAYTAEENPRPFSTNKNLRTAGGHVHIGINGLSEEIKRDIIRRADAVLGLISILEDTDKTRRELYGKAGAYRSKSYGVEYRTLSNYWLTDTKALTRIVKFLRSLSSDFGDGTFKLAAKANEWGAATVEAIDTQNEALVHYVREVLSEELKTCGLL